LGKIAKAELDTIGGFVNTTDLKTSTVGSVYVAKPLPATYYILVKATIGKTRLVKDTTINFDNRLIFVPIKFN
jgi:hypothetical protein